MLKEGAEILNCPDIGPSPVPVAQEATEKLPLALLDYFTARHHWHRRGG